MVDFSKRLGRKKEEKILDPVKLYNTLDRASDKGPLRPIQETILQKWHAEERNAKDIIIKLHTGQGKTLIGLLMLQSKLNEQKGPAVYLCYNNFLVEQTCEQARQFGVSYTTADGDLPEDFLESRSILITSVQKFFNGLTKFGIGARSLRVPTLLIDDAHACIEAIKASCVIEVPQSDGLYEEIFNLFEGELESQGVGTFAEIQEHRYDALLHVPYWDWIDKHSEVARKLARSAEKKNVKFAWPLIKDILADCRCIISGTKIEISPYAIPLELYGSYSLAEHRIFMTASVIDDSFLLKGLGVSKQAIQNPLEDTSQAWSGERMILIPSLIDSSLDRGTIVQTFGKPMPGRTAGIVALCPSFSSTKDWEKYGATIATTDTIASEIEQFRKRKFDKTLVMVNRYDGIDLPDEMCRILVFDSLPHPETLIDLYMESCRKESSLLILKTANMIEQGLGRSVRGEKDFCAVVLTGEGLVRTLRGLSTKQFFSSQTQTQIELGTELAEMAKEEIEDGKPPIDALRDLINQCLRRDPSWKAFYAEQMESMKAIVPRGRVLDILELEFSAQEAYRLGKHEVAISKLQKLIDSNIKDDSDKGWYLQEMARYSYPFSKVQSNNLQLAAHRKNRYLLRPRTGMEISLLTVLSQRRVQSIIEWVRACKSGEELMIVVDEILSNLAFGVEADRFEQALSELGAALGFATSRPDKEWKEGPDNLWCVRDGEYVLFEAKSETKTTRAEINKSETGQMNNACAWFRRNYRGTRLNPILIIPTRTVGKAAGFNEAVFILHQAGLKNLTRAVRAFFLEFARLDFEDLSETKVQQFLAAHKLTVDEIINFYAVQPKFLHGDAP